jgi:hypothetical protein
MNKILIAIAKANTVKKLKMLIKWMKKNEVDEGYIVTALQRLRTLELIQQRRK